MDAARACVQIAALFLIKDIKTITDATTSEKRILKRKFLDISAEKFKGAIIHIPAAFLARLKDLYNGKV